MVPTLNIVDYRVWLSQTKKMKNYQEDMPDGDHNRYLINNLGQIGWRNTGDSRLDPFSNLFSGFVESDFASYEKEKWSSHRFNRERLVSKQKLSSLGKSIENFLEDKNLKLTSDINSHIPSFWNGNRVKSQWLYFKRNQNDEKRLSIHLEKEISLADRVKDPAEHHRHVILFVNLVSDGISVGVGLHKHAVIDFKNILSKQNNLWEREQLEHLLSLIGPGFRFLFGDVDLPAPEAGLKQVQSALQSLTIDQDWVRWQKYYPANKAIVAGKELQSLLVEDIAEMLPVFSYILWTQGNDHISLKEKIEVERVNKKRSHIIFRKGDRVLLTRGLFKGKRGVVQAINKKGEVSVIIGTITIQVDGKGLESL